MIVDEASLGSGNIAFLLVFIILPTAVVVSGFWAILFVVRTPDRVSTGDPVRESEESAPIVEGDEDLSTQVGVSETPTTASEAATQANMPTTDQQAVEEFNPLVADLLYNYTPLIQEADSIDREPISGVPTDFLELRLPEPAETETPETEEIPELTESLSSAGTELDQLAPETEQTDSEDEVLDESTWRPPFAQSRHDNQASDRPSAQQREAADLAESSAVTFTTSNSSKGDDDNDREEAFEPVEIGDASRTTVIEDTASPDASDEHKPRAMLVPTHAADARIRKRARTSGRRVPQLGRSTRRDERVVESRDGPSDI